MRVMGEMSERYVRDENDPSHAQIPLYKGDSSDYVRDERFSRKLSVDDHFRCTGCMSYTLFLIYVSLKVFQHIQQLAKGIVQLVCIRLIFHES